MNRFRSLLLLLMGFLIAVIFLLIVGESPIVFLTAVKNTLTTGFGWGYTLYFATPLIFTGLSVALAFHAGLFNLGAEGQLHLGALGTVLAAFFLPQLPWPLAWALGIFGAILLGGGWGAVAGWLKAKRSAHEVIITILMNFIAIAIVDYALLTFLRNPEQQQAESIPTPANYWLPLFSKWIPALENTPVNGSFILGILACLLVYFILHRTPFGFSLRVVGKNKRVAQFAGIAPDNAIVISFFLSGALAGMVGVNELMGYEHRLMSGFSPGYGFTGIAVALLANNHPIGIFFSAFLFAVLQNSAREMEFLSDHATKEISLVIQGVLVAVLICDRWFQFRKERR